MQIRGTYLMMFAMITVVIVICFIIMLIRKSRLTFLHLRTTSQKISEHASKPNANSDSDNEKSVIEKRWSRRGGRR
jgi:hypothetical protein